MKKAGKLIVTFALLSTVAISAIGAEQTARAGYQYGTVMFTNEGANTNFNPQGYIGYKTLSVDGAKQEKTNWCWAATSQSIIKYKGKASPSQTDIVKLVKGSDVNEGAYFKDELNSLRWYNLNTVGIDNATVTFSVIQNEINADKPIKASIKWHSGGGHDFVVRGFYEDTDKSIRNVYYTDPWPGNDTWNIKPYNEFSYNSSWRWYQTYYNNQ